MFIIENLSKHFGDKRAVRDISMKVIRGQVLGLLGPNGAGKSTTMKMAAGYLRPTAGRVLLSGIDIWQEPAKAKKVLGYLPESAPLYEEMTAEEYLFYIARLRGIKREDTAQAIDSVVDSCFLKPVRSQAINTLSKGYRHRVCLAQSLIGDPEILIFDEPTDGLDPNQKQEIRNLIDSIRPHKCIIVSTHILEEVEAICTDTFILNNGRQVFTGTPEELQMQSEDYGELKLVVTGNDIPDSVVGTLSRLPDITVVEERYRSNRKAIFTIGTAVLAPQNHSDLCKNLTMTAASMQLTVTELSRNEGSIAKAFRQLTQTSCEPKTH